MQKNKFTTYLLYAVGEIFLVVIGILIAVSINNWNQGRLAKEEEKVLLKALGKAMEKDSLAFYESKDRLRLIFNIYETLFKIHEGILPADSLKKVDLLRRNVRGLVVSPSHYPNITSEIQDPKVKASVLDYYEILSRQEGIRTNYNQFVEHRMRPFLGAQQLLNYGFHHQDSATLKQGDSDTGMINVQSLVGKLADKAVQQVLFEGAQKSKNLFGLEANLEDQRQKLRQEIKRALSN